jgi:hypothetical protein
MLPPLLTALPIPVVPSLKAESGQPAPCGTEGRRTRRPVPFLDLFQGRDELVVYQHMWYDGAPHQGQCEGRTTTAWHLKDAVYLNAPGVSFAILTTGRWDEVASCVECLRRPPPRPGQVQPRDQMLPGPLVARQLYRLLETQPALDPT